MSAPQDLKYTQSHEWARIEGETVTVGITDFAQEQLGDLTFVELPQMGDVLEAGQPMGSVESVKAASDIYAPVTGEVIAVNEELDAAPELINEDAYDKGWMVKIKASDIPGSLLDADAYEEAKQACSE